ncbi:hypothetical protein [Natrinema sp. H-ect4]|uniref:hypothetical protein n=1 Tax=Natrinema sp. H-ect4 TaxID=3242699 RepID=UPI0035A85A6E
MNVEMMLSGFVIGVLILWLGATVVNSFKPGSKFLVQHCGLLAQLVPKWNFFSPHPGRYDYHVLYRDRTAGDTATEWQRVSDFSRTSGVLGWVWNPDIYRYKALFDVVQELQIAVEEKQSRDGTDQEVPTLEPMPLDEIQMSLSYIALLNYVTHQRHSELSETTQFTIMKHSREIEQYEPVFVSGYHSISQKAEP